jgi:hypothetical protein
MTRSPGYRDQHEDGDACERDIIAIELAENSAPGAVNQVASTVAQVVGQALDALNTRRKANGAAAYDPRLKSTAVAATSVAIGAVEGTLKGKSLQGALAEAQVIREYATAAKEQAEADRIRFEMAWAQVQNTLSLFQTLGIQVKMVTLPDGRAGIAIGDGLALPLPGIVTGGEASQEAAPSREAAP